MIDFFLVMGVFKMLLYLAVIGITLFILIRGYRHEQLERRQASIQSVHILNSLSRVSFSALNMREPDEECIICYEKYTDDDSVIKLDCNDKHIFHSKCIETWISQG